MKQGKPNLLIKRFAGVQGGWQPQPIVALRAIPRLTELFAAGVEAGKFAAGLIKMSERHLRLKAKNKELRAKLKSPPAAEGRKDERAGN